MFCKFCGYEYNGEDLRFCPNCGKKLSDGDNWVTAESKENADENTVKETSDNTDEIKEEIAVTVVDTQPSISANNTEEEPLGNIFKKWGWKIMEYGFAIILGVGILFWAIEAATGFPIKDRVLGVSDTEAQPIYKKASNIIKNGIPFDVDIPKFKSKYVWHRGVRTEKFDQGEIRLDAYVATIPVTFHFDKYVDREVDVKIWFWKFDEDDNSMDVYSKFDGLKEGIQPIKLWDTDRKFGDTDGLNIYMKEVYESWENLITVIFNEMQRSYNNTTERDNDYDNYADEYLISRMTERYKKSEVAKEAMDLLATYVDLNIESLSNKYPALFEENENYTGYLDGEDYTDNSESYEEEDYTNDEYIDDTDSSNEDAYYDVYYDEYDDYDYDEDAIKEAALKKIKPSLSILSSGFVNMDITYPDAEDCTLTYETLTEYIFNTPAQYGEFTVTVPVTITFKHQREKYIDLRISVLSLNLAETSLDDARDAIEKNEEIIVRPFWGVGLSNQTAEITDMTTESRDKLLHFIMEELTSEFQDVNISSSEEFNETYKTYIINSLLGTRLEVLRNKYKNLDENSYKFRCLSSFFEFIEARCMYDSIVDEFPKIFKVYDE